MSETALWVLLALSLVGLAIAYVALPYDGDEDDDHWRWM